jgi:hypothetical protein
MTTQTEALTIWARTYLSRVDLPPVTHRAVTLLLGALNDAENQRDDARSEVDRLRDELEARR